MKADKETLATNLPGIFAGGDAVTGTTFIVDAIAAGHKAATSIERYLSGLPLTAEELRPPRVALDEAEVKQRLESSPSLMAPRHETQARPAEERRLDFGEVYLGLIAEEAQAEAARCLGCGICSECLQCVFACRAGAIDHNQVEEIVELQVGAVMLAPGSSR